MACIGDIVIVSRREEMSDGVRRLLGQLPPSLQAITALDISQVSTSSLFIYHFTTTQSTIHITLPQRFEDLNEPSKPFTIQPSTTSKRKLPSPPTALSAAIKKQSEPKPIQKPVTPPSPPSLSTYIPPQHDVEEPRLNPKSRSHSTHSLNSEHTMIKVDSWEPESPPKENFG